MPKVIAAMNMTLDGFCDHTVMDADDEIHEHYNGLLKSADAALYGRITYQLMEYWKSVVDKPTGNKSTDDFAVTMDQVPKLVFSNTLKTLDWKTAKLATRGLEEEVSDLKRQVGNEILIGSPSLIVASAQLGLVDEYQLAVHPTVVGSGLRLFRNITERIDLKLLKTKPFECGAVIHYYQPRNG